MSTSKLPAPRSANLSSDNDSFASFDGINFPPSSPVDSSFSFLLPPPPPGLAHGRNKTPLEFFFSPYVPFHSRRLCWLPSPSDGDSP